MIKCLLIFNFLFCGDMSLELVGRYLEHLRSGIVLPRNNPWLNVTSSIRSFIEGSPGKITGVSEDEDDWVVFIDTNPSFSVYTEIALAGARKLLIPINADDFSVEAVRAMLDLVYGIHREEEPEHFQAYRQYAFSSKATEYGLRRPKIHLLINNRTTTISTRSAAAFEAMGEANLSVLYQAYQDHQAAEGCFVPREEEQIADIESFKAFYFEDVRDFHTTAILSLHSGCPLEGLSGTIALTANKSVKTDRSRVETYLECLDKLVGRL